MKESSWEEINHDLPKTTDDTGAYTLYELALRTTPLLVQLFQA